MPKDENNFPKLAQPAAWALAGAGIRPLEQLAGCGESEIRQLHGIGPNALKTLGEALAAKGLSFQEEKIEGVFHNE